MAQGTLPGFISALRAGLRPVALRNVLRASRNKKEFHFNRRVTLLYLLIIVFFSTFVSSFSASALDTFIRPLFEKVSGFSAIDDIFLVFQKMNFSVFLSYLLPRIPITLLDRCICTFAAYGIYLRLRK